VKRYNGGAGGRGPTGDGQTPIALEIQLGSPGADVEGEDGGDPIYGRVFNTSAVQGVQAEGTATVRYTEIYGYYYPDGTRWRMRAPHYRLTGLTRGGADTDHNNQTAVGTGADGCGVARKDSRERDHWSDK